MRTTGFDKNIDEATFMELQSLDCSYGFEKVWKTEKIPEIKESNNDFQKLKVQKNINIFHSICIIRIILKIDSNE